MVIASPLRPSLIPLSLALTLKAIGIYSVKSLPVLI